MRGHNYDHGCGDICKTCGRTHINPFWNRKHTKETKEIIRKKMEGRIITWGDKVSKTKKRIFAKNPDLGMETTKPMREWAKIHGNPFKGKTHTPGSIKKISDKLKGRKHTPEHRQNISTGVNKRYEDPEFRALQLRKNREAHLGKKHTVEQRARQSHGIKKAWVDPEHKKKKAGQNHWNWKGGISNNSYEPEFNEELRLVIRTRDSFYCQYCGVAEGDLGERLAVHHIDYDKSNNHFSNLISLCRACNVRANYTRLFWEKYYVVKLVTNLVNRMGRVDQSVEVVIL